MSTSLMRIHIVQFFALIAVCVQLDMQETQAAGKDRRSQTAATVAKPAFVFAGVDYFHRWSQNDQHEFTPESQRDLENGRT